METIDNIPISKIKRASKLVGTGAKVGVNYLKYYGSKLVKSEEEAKLTLDKNNAEDIYNSLKQLKGSALKVAQMLSMEKSIMPAAYVEKFSLSQFSVPPLSPPLVNKTFKSYFGKTPNEIFDEFNTTSNNAASIGQVHRAKKNGNELAVKIQYPGVAESISSDLKMVKPIALKILNISPKDSEKYFKEVEDKLIEETDYVLELKQSQEISNACKSIPNLLFPKYYEEFSSDRIITMDWMNGKHLSEYTFNEANSNKIGQALWDFYMYQIHKLNKVHADPHPGNFMISADEKLIALDFGCMKTIPKEFYTPYFELTQSETLNDKKLFEAKILELEIIKATDTEEEKSFFTEMFHELLTAFATPLNADYFDFSDSDFFLKIAQLGEKYTKNTELRKMDANRGSKHFIYVNRTFFGLYNLMHMIQSKNIKINNYKSL
ncbi:ABC1 kinase family protein [Brumimicrobium aurantiacum]|uniref:AarF/ABC1/UbiB kinase family protein n=1 Tax=Brumimicrobium aurantiacum TaxID=1737063 RepID=A0A3E1EZX8_9FLAO|nr:AarF/UbiB family protein [Brumimicrobium aurantiacum]RFC55033.1 AarF/ABC1/UbiB kinase family protein [Brumimicrobium aurantiacum]